MSPTEYDPLNAQMVEVCAYGPLCLWRLHPGIQTTTDEKIFSRMAIIQYLCYM